MRDTRNWASKGGGCRVWDYKVKCLLKGNNTVLSIILEFSTQKPKYKWLPQSQTK